MNFFLGLSKGIDWVTTKIGQAMWWVSLFMVLIGAFNVVTRYAFSFIQGAFGTDVAQALSGNRYLSMQTFAYNPHFYARRGLCSAQRRARSCRHHFF